MTFVEETQKKTNLFGVSFAYLYLYSTKDMER